MWDASVEADVEKSPKAMRHLNALKNKPFNPTFINLEDNIVIKILLNLDIKSTCRASQVCKRFHKLVSCDIIWKKFCVPSLFTDKKTADMSYKRFYWKFFAKPFPAGEWNIFVYGETGIGKSNLVLKFYSNTLDPNYDPTLEDCFSKKLGTSFMYLWDTVSNEKYSSPGADPHAQVWRESNVLRAYQLNTACFIFSYSIDSKKKFQRSQ